jgi:cell division septum initiation protein DivIVA
MDLIDRIEELQVLIEEAKSVPLSSSAVINRDEMLELLVQLKERVPDEIRQARWMTRDRDDLLARAHKEAERIVSEARSQRDRLVADTEIVHAAHKEGDRIVDEAKDRATKLRVEAEDYVDQRLAAFEIWLNKTSKAVAKGRAQLQGTGAGAPEGEVPVEASQGPFDVTEHAFGSAELGAR